VPPNTAVELQPKGCSNQSLLIAACDVLSSGQVVVVAEEDCFKAD